MNPMLRLAPVLLVGAFSLGIANMILTHFEPQIRDTRNLGMVAYVYKFYPYYNDNLPKKKNSMA